MTELSRTGLILSQVRETRGAADATSRLSVGNHQHVNGPCCAAKAVDDLIMLIALLALNHHLPHHPPFLTPPLPSCKISLFVPTSPQSTPNPYQSALKRLGTPIASSVKSSIHMSASSLKSSKFANVDLGTPSELGLNAIIQALLKSQAPHVINASSGQARSPSNNSRYLRQQHVSSNLKSCVWSRVWRPRRCPGGVASPVAPVLSRAQCFSSLVLVNAGGAG
ncbi:hypothetical protein B0H19DRAFT_1311442 [Mycena capillaripes]|nr:hypothetical protein B0H19DRAFT_1311442 [Mycena capillaripes]